MRREEHWWDRKKTPWELYPTADNPKVSEVKLISPDKNIYKVEYRWWVDTCPEVADRDDSCPGYILEHGGPNGEWHKRLECPLHGYRWIRPLMTELELKEDIRMRVNAAQIPHFYQHYTLYNFPRKDGQAARSCAEYAAQGRLSGNLLLFGPYGTGKTSLAVSVLQERIAVRGESGLFQVVPALFEEIKASFGQEGRSVLFQRVMNVPLLVLDDLGAERATEWVAAQLYTILNHRLINSKPTIVTTNLDTEELAGQLGQRTVERLKSYRVIHVGGGNLRDEREQAA